VKVMVLYLLLGAGLTLTSGWVVAARAIPSSAEPAVDALDIAASAVLLLMICWNVPKFTAGVLGGTPAFTGGDAVGTVGGIAQGALLAGAAVAGGVALGAKVLAARGGAMSVGQAAGMGSGGSGGSAGGFGMGGPANPAGGGLSPKPNVGGGGAAVSPNGSAASPQVSPPTAGAGDGQAGGDQVSPPAQADSGRNTSGDSSASARREGSDAPAPVPPPGMARRSTGVERTRRITRGMLTTTAMVRAAQSAVPPDHAPHAAPPPLNTGADE
jgi:type IV secretory pathway TrbL component